MLFIDLKSHLVNRVLLWKISTSGPSRKDSQGSCTFYADVSSLVDLMKLKDRQKHQETGQKYSTIQIFAKDGSGETIAWHWLNQGVRDGPFHLLRIFSLATCVCVFFFFLRVTCCFLLASKPAFQNHPESSTRKWDDMLSRILYEKRFCFHIAFCTDRHFVRNHHKFCKWQKSFPAERVSVSNNDHLRCVVYNNISDFLNPTAKYVIDRPVGLYFSVLWYLWTHMLLLFESC